MALVEAAVGRAGALGIDTEQAAAGEHLPRRRQRPLRRRPALPLDRDLPDGAEEPRRLRVLEVLGLGHEGDPSPEDERQEDRVAERDVVAGEDGRAPLGDVLAALGTDAEGEA